MLKTYFYKLLSFTNNISIKLGAILAGFFSPIQGIIFLCMILAFMDFFIKLYVVYTTEGREAIKSKKMEDTLYKILFYSAAITVIHLVDVIFVKDVGADLFKMLFNDSAAEILVKLKLAAGVAFIIILRELKSIDESWEQKFGWSFLTIAQEQVKAIFKFRHGIKITKNKRGK